MQYKKKKEAYTFDNCVNCFFWVKPTFSPFAPFILNFTIGALDINLISSEKKIKILFMLWRIYDNKYIHNSENTNNKELTKNLKMEFIFDHPIRKRTVWRERSSNIFVYFCIFLN